MTIKADILQPGVSVVDVVLDAEIVFNLFDDGDQPIDLSTIDVTVDQGSGPASAMTGGVFVNDWTGELIDNSINNSDLNIILIRPTSNPTYNPGVKVTVDIDASLE